MSGFVPVDHVIDLDVELDPKALSPTTFFNSKMRLAAGVSLPPVSIQAGKIVGDFDALDKFLAQDQGSTVADPIEAPAVSELSELRSPTTQRKNRLG
jgi:hypothetical protein